MAAVVVCTVFNKNIENSGLGPSKPLDSSLLFLHSAHNQPQVSESQALCSSALFMIMCLNTHIPILTCMCFQLHSEQRTQVRIHIIQNTHTRAHTLDGCVRCVYRDNMLGCSSISSRSSVSSNIAETRSIFGQNTRAGVFVEE